VSGARYKGTIKFFRGSFGWVACEDVWGQYGRDTFLHINDCDGGYKPELGDVVMFSLSEDNVGNPKAVHAHPQRVIAARDWFQKRDSASRR